MAKRSIIEDEEATEINLSPMIDCVFILLIFFIVTTVFVEEQGIQVAKPDAAAPLSIEEKDGVTLEITSENQIFLDGRKIALTDVTGRVETALAASGPETPVVIRAHEKSAHGTFVGVWDAARRGGAETLTFSTVD